MAASDASDIVERLRFRWRVHLADLRTDSAGVNSAFDDLARRYCEPHRAYHNLLHIEQVLDVVEFLRRYALDLTSTRLAAWFHDAFYDPRGKDNEARSAQYAGSVLGGLGYAPLRPVQYMILATQSHDHAGADLDTLVLLDADLAILGAAPEVYADYAAAIRKEYFWVPEARFYAGRSEVLERLLLRDSIFALPEMRERFEQQARENLQAELESLR